MAKQNAIKFDHRAFEDLTPIRFAMFSHTRHFARAATRLAASFISNEARYVAFWHETDLLGGSGHVWSRGIKRTWLGLAVTSVTQRGSAIPISNRKGNPSLETRLTEEIQMPGFRKTPR
jgi:hypothetical protein